MEVILVRHAKSAHDYSKWKTDDIRPLASKGRSRQAKTSKGMLEQGITYSHIWVSPFLRAQQTLEIIQSTFGTSIEPEVVDELRVWGDPRLVQGMILDFARNNPDSKLLIVGHNPNISSMAEIMTGEYISMSTSDVVRMNVAETSTLIEYLPREDLY
ncbi:MAG: SixA phosphatase family protein [Candidatus Kariarchaeaceae archaeon]